MLLRFIPLLFVLAASAQAAEMTATDAFALGRGFGTSANAGVPSGISSSEAESKIPNYSTTSSRSSLYGGMRNIGPDGLGQTTYCKTTGYTSTDPKEKLACDATNLLSDFRLHAPTIAINKSTDPIMVRKRAIQANPEASSLTINSSTTACTPTTSTSADVTRTETCFDYVGAPTASSCQMPWDVEVVQHNRYQCDQGKPGTQQTCSNTLALDCGPMIDGCDVNAISSSSWSPDMATTWQNMGNGTWNLTFGTIADNYWSGWGAIFDKTLYFNVSNKDKISFFTLVRAAFDDWILVRVNGTIVYAGPYGGDRLERVVSCNPDPEFPFCITQVQYCATCYSSPELNTSWNFSLNIDLKPYLVNGANKIETRTIVAGNGESAIVIATRQYCECTKTWVNGCAPYQ